jgi:hypothetical protein
MPTAFLPQTLTPFHARYYAYELTRRRPPDVPAKRQAAEEWCVHAFTYAATYGGKPRCYATVALKIVAENMTSAALLRTL